MKNDRQSDVLIVGGGLAGLTCGVALAREGRRVRVIDAASRLGGRAQSWKDPKTGDVIDLGPHILLSTYPNMLKFLAWLGTDDLVQWQDQGMIDQVRGTEVLTLDFGRLPAPFHFLPSLLRNFDVSFLDITSNAPLLARAISADDSEIDRHDSKNAVELLREFGVSARVIEGMWRFVGMAILNLPLEECSGAAFLRFVRFLTGRRDYRIGFAKVGLGELFCEQSVRFIEERGGSVSTDTAARTVRTDGTRVTGVELTDGTVLQAGSYVLALDPQALARVLPSPLRERAGVRQLEKFESCPYLSVYLWFDRPITERAFWARAHREDDLNCDFYDLSKFRDGMRDRPSLIASNIIYSHRAASMTDEEVVARTLDELAEFVPAAREAKLVHGVVNRIPMAIHCPRPGTETLRPASRAIEGNLYLAGDWIRTGFPSSMESACAAGFMATEAILRDQGTPVAMSLRDELAKLPRFIRLNAKIWDRVFRGMGLSPGRSVSP